MLRWFKKDTQSEISLFKSHPQQAVPLPMITMVNSTLCLSFLKKSLLYSRPIYIFIILR